MKKYIYLITLFIVSLIPLINLLNPGLPITHDGQDHVARIANFHKNLEEGNMIPRWAANLNWGYGHPVMMFLYPLPSYIASLFHYIGFSLVDSFKLTLASAYVLSGLAFYLWAKTFLPKYAAFFGAALYVIAPYRFVDLYVRGAIGEHTAFLFIPLVLYFMKAISEKISIWHIVGGAFSLAGLILSHNAISLMFLPIFFFYFLYLFRANNKIKYLTHLGLVFVLGLGLSSFFWLPAFIEGKYTLRDIVTAKEYASRFVPFKDFIYGSWSYGGTVELTKQLGILHWVVVLGSLVTVAILQKTKYKVLVAGSAILLFLTLFLMNSGSLFLWDNFSVLQKFQFPWRFLSVTVFLSAVLGGIFLSNLKKYTTQLTILAIIVLLILNKDFWKAQDYRVYDEESFKTVYKGTTDTGESSPIWSVRFMEKSPEAHLEFISGRGEIKEVKRTSAYHEYDIDITEESRLRENTLYFPGWRVLLDGEELPVEFQDPKNRGLITFNVGKGRYKLVVKFENTKLRQFAEYLSLGSLIFMLSFIKVKKL